MCDGYFQQFVQCNTRGARFFLREGGEDGGDVGSILHIVFQTEQQCLACPAVFQIPPASTDTESEIIPIRNTSPVIGTLSTSTKPKHCYRAGRARERDRRTPACAGLTLMMEARFPSPLSLSTIYKSERSLATATTAAAARSPSIYRLSQSPDTLAMF